MLLTLFCPKKSDSSTTKGGSRSIFLLTNTITICYHKSPPILFISCFASFLRYGISISIYNWQQHKNKSKALCRPTLHIKENMRFKNHSEWNASFFFVTFWVHIGLIVSCCSESLWKLPENRNSIAFKARIMRKLIR